MHIFLLPNDTDWADLEDHLVAGDGFCDIAVGMDVLHSYLKQGIVFTWPTFRNGFRVLVSIEKAPPGWFAFTAAFTWEVWVAIVATAIAVGFIVWGIDAFLTRRRRPSHSLDCPSDSQAKPVDMQGLQSYFWQSMGRGMQVQDQIGVSFAANLVILAYAFLMLVMVTLFTANTTAHLTTQQLMNPIRGVQDLPGKAVVTWTDYTDTLSKYGVVAAGKKWDSDDDELAMVNLVRGGAAKALVLEATTVEQTAAQDCSLEVVGSMFEQVRKIND